MKFREYALHYIFLSLRYRKNPYKRTMLLTALSEEMFNHWQYEAETFTGRYILARKKGFFGGTKVYWEKRLRCLYRRTV